MITMSCAVMQVVMCASSLVHSSSETPLLPLLNNVRRGNVMHIDALLYADGDELAASVVLSFEEDVVENDIVYAAHRGIV